MRRAVFLWCSDPQLDLHCLALKTNPDSAVCVVCGSSLALNFKCNSYESESDVASVIWQQAEVMVSVESWTGYTVAMMVTFCSFHKESLHKHSPRTETKEGSDLVHAHTYPYHVHIHAEPTAQHAQNKQTCYPPCRELTIYNSSRCFQEINLLFTLCTSSTVPFISCDLHERQAHQLNNVS